MNYFEMITTNLIMFLFPFCIYLFYLINTKNLERKEKKLIFTFTILSSCYLTYKYNGLLLMFPALILISYKNKNYELILIIIFLLFKSLSNINIDFNYSLIIKVIIMIFLNYISVKLLKMYNNIIKYHLNSNEIVNHDNLKESLFKITHEVKNPLAVCTGYLEILKKDYTKSEKYIPIISTEIDRCLMLLEDYLSLNKMKISKDIMDINMLLEDSIKTMKIIMKDKKIEGIFDIADDEYFINGDYNRLMQVFINIIKNSIEATKNGFIKIKTVKDDDKVIITIEDSGEGMSDETIRHFKEPFYTTKQKGTGLGVPMCFEIIEAHNGEITYDTKLGLGTVVTIKLDLICAE
jgi:signal transduction histidine kinase